MRVTNGQLRAAKPQVMASIGQSRILLRLPDKDEVAGSIPASPTALTRQPQEATQAPGSGSAADPMLVSQPPQGPGAVALVVVQVVEDHASLLTSLRLPALLPRKDLCS